MDKDNRIEIKICKSNEGSIYVDTKMSEDATEDEVVDLVMDFIRSLIPAKDVVHF